MKVQLWLLLSVLGLAVPAVAIGAPDTAQAQEYILEQLRDGNIADLRQQFPNEDDRLLSAAFLQGLILNDGQKFAIHRNGVRIHGAVISEPINLSNSEIAQMVDLSNCHFTNVRFFQTVFKKGLFMKDSVFDGEVYFAAATINGGLFFTRSHFDNHDKGANFQALKVNGPAVLDQTTFQGPATFAYAVVDGVFQLSGAYFANKDQEAVFNSMNIDRGFFAEKATFEGGVDLINVRLGDNFEGAESHFNNPKTEISIVMIIRRNLFLGKATFSGKVDFSNTSVGGNIELDQTVFATAPNLSHVTYESISSHVRLLDLLRNSPSDYSAYNELESYFQKNGSSSEADEVFMEKKRYERRQGLNWFESLKSYLSEILTGFGRRPYRVLYYDLIIVLIGAALFRHRKMVLKSKATEKTAEADRTEQTTLPYNAFLYSLTLFAPTIDSQYTNNWQPAPEYRRTKGYRTFEKVAGYILVPLTIAIWTGIFK